MKSMIFQEKIYVYRSWDFDKMYFYREYLLQVLSDILCPLSLLFRILDPRYPVMWCHYFWFRSYFSPSPSCPPALIFIPRSQSQLCDALRPLRFRKTSLAKCFEILRPGNSFLKRWKVWNWRWPRWTFRSMEDSRSRSRFNYEPFMVSPRHLRRKNYQKIRSYASHSYRTQTTMIP